MLVVPNSRYKDGTTKVCYIMTGNSEMSRLLGPESLARVGLLCIWRAALTSSSQIRRQTPKRI